MKLIKFRDRVGECAINPDLVTFVAPNRGDETLTRIWSVGDQDPVEVVGEFDAVINKLSGGV